MPPTLTVAPLPDARYVADPSERFRAALLGVLAASGSLVFIEPAPYDILAIVMLVGLLATGLRFPAEIRTHVVLLALFVVGNVVAAAASAEPVDTIRSLSIRIYLPLTWLLVVCLVVRDPKRMLAALWVGYLVAAVFAAVWGVLEYLGLIDVSGLEGRVKALGAGMRARGAFKDPNVFGPFLVPAAVYAASRVVYGRHLARAAFAVLLFLFLFGILLSFSRGAWMNCAVALLVFSFLAYRHSTSVKARMAGVIVATLGVAATVAMIAGALSFGAISERFYQRAVLTQAYDVRSGGRFDTQRKVLIEIGTDPIGVGPGRSDEEFGLEPHNLYLHVTVEGGWIGGLCFMAFVAIVLAGITRATRGPSRLRSEAMIVFSALCGVLVQTPFIDCTHWRHLWLLLALSTALAIAIGRSRRSDLPLQGATIR